MKRSLFVALGVMIALQPVQASAQIFNGTPNSVEYLNFIEGSHQGGTYGVQVGPYSGRFGASASRTAPTSPFALYCVDYEHYASNSNGLVNVSSLGGDLSNTRIGSTDATHAYDRYKQSAFLSSLYDSWGSHQSTLTAGFAGTFSKAEVWGGLHAAIWNISTGPTTLGSGRTAVAREYFLGLANGDLTDFSTEGWYLLSEADVGLSSRYSGQEFLMRVAVPEPSTIFLLLTGMVLLVGANRKRLVVLDQGV